MKNEELEIKLSFLEETVTTLNTQVVALQTQVDDLTAANQLLNQRLHSLSSNLEDQGIKPFNVDDDIPPHY